MMCACIWNCIIYVRYEAFSHYGAAVLCWGAFRRAALGRWGGNANVIPEVETNAPTRIVFQHCVCMWEYSAAHVFTAAPGCYGMS